MIPPEFLAVSYTRHVTQPSDEGGLEAMDGAEAARRAPSAIELRLDVKGCDVFTDEEKRRIIAFKSLGADRRGVVRVIYGDAETRPKNLIGARKLITEFVCEAMQTPVAELSVDKPRRRKAGLTKTTDR